MTRTIATTLGAIAAAAALAAPALAATQIQAPMAQTTFTTSLTQTGPFATPGAVTGKLIISISADGIVQGWYIPDDDGQYILVNGGLNNGRLWLTVGQGSGFEVTAEMQPDGSLTGSGFDAFATALSIQPGAAPATYDFEATPAG